MEQKKPHDAQSWKAFAVMQFRSDALVGLARRGVSTANIEQLRTGKIWHNEELDEATARELLFEIEEGLVRGYFDLGEIGTTVEEWGALCEKYGHTSFYNYFAVPEIFSLSKGKSFTYPVKDYPDFTLVITVWGEIGRSGPEWHTRCELQDKEGSRDLISTGMHTIRGIQLENPEQIANSASFVCKPVIELKMMLRPFQDGDFH